MRISQKLKFWRKYFRFNSTCFPNWNLNTEYSCESICPGFSIFCVQQFMQFSLFRPHSLFFAFSFYLLASPRQDGMPRNRGSKKKERKREKQRPKIRELHELLFREISKIWDYYETCLRNQKNPKVNLVSYCTCMQGNNLPRIYWIK